jgi:hypothetical protein
VYGEDKRREFEEVKERKEVAKGREEEQREVRKEKE